jgi:hypothetical protein
VNWGIGNFFKPVSTIKKHSSPQESLSSMLSSSSTSSFSSDDSSIPKAMAGMRGTVMAAVMAMTQ